ncbi:MAG: TerC family protein [Alphaproteobacteria bacterium]|nr:TerC family protein [Alphaproteobacteria bacterium]MCL2452343.1 TerC family protein [Alphaproteobacteria bacterium]
MDSAQALITDPSAWLALVTLVAMEIVLGVDNLIFVALLSSKLPVAQAGRARCIGVGLSLIFRVLLLAGAAYVVHLTRPVFSLFRQAFSWRDLILIAGGLFLVFKATREIHVSVEPKRELKASAPKSPAFLPTVAQITLLDLVFSIDSIITAVGMTDHVVVMVIAVILAVTVMLVASGMLAGFLHKNPTIVMLALGFLLMIGTTLIADGFGFHFPKGYIYAAMAFSAAVEALNTLVRKRRKRPPD